MVELRMQHFNGDTILTHHNGTYHCFILKGDPSDRNRSHSDFKWILHRSRIPYFRWDFTFHHIRFQLSIHFAINDFQQLNVIVKALPSPMDERTEISPFCRCIICCEILSPIPDPLFFVEKNGIKICSRFSRGMPHPVSAM